MNKLAIGEFSVLELVKHHPSNVKRIIVKNKHEQAKYFKYKVPVIIDERYIDKMVKKEDIYAIAEFTPYNMKLATKSPHILITNLDDEGELGTILRTLVAFSYFNVAIINGPADLFSTKIIRASTGAIFMMNVESFKTKKDYQNKYHNEYLEFINKDEPLSLTVGAKLYRLKSK